MAYQLTNALSVEDLVNKIATFAGANGWTVHRNNLSGSLRTLTVSKGGDYVHLWNEDTSSVSLKASVGYSAGAAADSQPNQATSTAKANTGTGPFSNVFLFESSSCLSCVFEIASGIFRHLSFGMLQKFGAYTGGTFFDAMFYDATGGYGSQNQPLGISHHIMFSNDSRYCTSRGAVRCDVDGNTNYFAPFARREEYATPVASGGMGDETPSGGAALGDDGTRTTSAFYARSINAWSGISPLQPIKIRVERASDYWSEIGSVPGVRLMNMARFGPADEFTIGADTWKVFPWARKGYEIDEEYSLEYAFAYLKV